MTLGIVSNARSERNKAGMAGLLEVIDGAPGIAHLAFDGSRPFGVLLRELAGRGVTVVGVNGGDGTAQGVMTALLEERPFAEMPPVAVLPRGMANTTGTDVGLKDRSPASLRRLIAAVHAGRLDRHLVARPVLRVENIKDWPPQRGMFFGAAGISEVIDICKQKVHALGFKGEASHALTLAGLLLVATTRGLDAAGLHGHEVGVAFDDGPMESRSRLLVLATTLERLVLGSRPFWNTDQGPVHFTSVAYPPLRLLRHARQVLYGGRARSLPSPAYESRGARKVGLDLAGSFTIDGQFFEPEPGRPLVLTADDSIRFVRL